MEKFCTNCGKELHTGARFCAKCGAPVLDGSVSPVPEEQPKPMAHTQTTSEVQPKEYTPPLEIPKIKSNKAPKRNNGRNTLCIMLSVLLVIQIVAVALYGWPGFFVKDRTQRLANTQIENGVAELPGMSVNFGGVYGGVTLENAKTAPIDLDEGAVSVGYELAFADIPEGEVTLSAPMPDDLTLAENERLYLDIGFSMQDETSEKVMVYDHIEASEQAGRMIARITPSGYSELSSNVYLKGEGFVSPTYSDKMRFNVQFKAKLVSASQSQRFNLIFDRSRFMATTVEPSNVEALLSNMEQVYAKYQEFGFDMSRRTQWPMNIHVTTLKNADATTPTYAQYVSSWWGIDSGYMNFSRLLFTNFNLDEATSIFAHELMHFVQECYVTTQYKRLAWLDEGTAVFLEKYFGGKGDHSGRQYELYDGIYPASDSASAGYARGALVAYWASLGGWYDGADALSGKDKMSGLIDLYSTGGYLQVSKWQNWIDDCMGAPSKYAIDFFTKLLQGNKSVWAENAYQPYTLHQIIVENAGKSAKDFSSKLDPNYAVSLFTSVLSLEVDKLTSEDGQEFELSVPAYGARVVALDMTEKEREKLDKDAAVGISAKNGEELVLLKSLSKETTMQQSVSISAPAFRKNMEDKYRYLLLVVNTTGSEKAVELAATCQTDIYLLYQDTFEIGAYYGGRTISEFYNVHGSMREGLSLDEFKRDHGYIITIEGKGDGAMLTVAEAPKGKEDSPLYVLGKDGISGTLDASGNIFTAAYGDGETIIIDFGAGTSYLDGPYTMRNFDSFMTPESRGLENGMRYGIQPYR
jgi:hypothetical protein